MTDLGKGDVVAAVHDLHVPSLWTAAGHSAYAIKAGQRAIVAEIVTTGSLCTGCGRTGSLTGLALEEYPLRRFVAWCPCEWRKVGGSEPDTVAQFARHLRGAPVLSPSLT